MPINPEAFARTLRGSNPTPSSSISSAHSPSPLTRLMRTVVAVRVLRGVVERLLEDAIYRDRRFLRRAADPRRAARARRRHPARSAACSASSRAAVISPKFASVVGRRSSMMRRFTWMHMSRLRAARSSFSTSAPCPGRELAARPRDVHLDRGQGRAQLVVQLAAEARLLGLAHLLQVGGEVGELRRALPHEAVQLLRAVARAQPVLLHPAHDEHQQDDVENRDRGDPGAGHLQARAPFVHQRVGALPLARLQGRDAGADALHALLPDVGADRLQRDLRPAGAREFQRLLELRELGAHEAGHLVESLELLQVAARRVVVADFAAQLLDARQGGLCTARDRPGGAPAGSRAVPDSASSTRDASSPRRSVTDIERSASW